MGSYVIVIMLSAFLNILPELPNVGYCLIEALKYFGTVFSPEGLAIADGRRIMVKHDPTPDLEVYDVFLPDVNAAANLTQFREIQKVFARSYNILCEGNIKSFLLEQVFKPVANFS